MYKNYEGERIDLFFTFAFSKFIILFTKNPKL